MSSRTRLCFPLAALTAVALFAAAPRARACTPLPEGVSGTIPAEGQKYPGNAAVILQGQGISLVNAAVSVDGVPATLTDVSNTLFNGLGLFAVTVTPTPAAGQAVTIEGKFCDAGASCPPVTLHYVATAALNALPSPVELVEYDIYDYPDFKSSGGDCQSDSDFAWWLHLNSKVPDQEKDGAVIYVIEGYTPAQSEGPAFTARGFVTSSWNPAITIRNYVGILGGLPLPEAAQFTVTTYNTAGNKSEAVKPVGRPCHYRADSAPYEGFPPAEPTWTAADIYPGGACDMTSTATGTGGASTGVGGSGGGAKDDVVVGGCGCRLAGYDESASGLFGALALALCTVRRRRGSLGSR